MILLPTKYEEIRDVFNKDKATSLPEHRPYNSPANHQPGKDLSWGPIYNLSPVELKGHVYFWRAYSTVVSETAIHDRMLNLVDV